VIFIWRDRRKRREISHEQVFEDLATFAQDLAVRQRNGVPVTHDERRAAAEALHILQGSRK
jgi:hypothetical protein